MNPTASQVLDLFRDSILLSFRKRPDFEVAIESLLENAVTLAEDPSGQWQQIIQGKIGEIRAQQIRQGHFDSKLIDVFDEAQKGFKLKLRWSQFWICYDSVYCDLHSCYLSRLLNMNDDFWNRMFEIYQGGYWPCGWEGAFPDGKFVIFEDANAKWIASKL